MKPRKVVLGVFSTAIGAVLSAAFCLPAFAVDVDKLPHVKQTLVAPPNLPAHDQVAKGGPVVVEVSLTVEEKPMVIDGDGTTVQAMTFNGSVPGPIIVVHQDDYVQLTLTNPASNTLEHNIDFHAATGALGGAGLTKVKPGESTILRFKAIKPGVFVYHCAPGGAMIPFHVISGMNGAIMVLPRDGLKDGKGKSLHYDKAWYIGEQDWYVPKEEKTGQYEKFGSPMEAMHDTLETARGLIPTHVTLGGKAFAYTGDAALTAKVGETVLIIHSQANRDSRPHLIGGHGDYVWERGKFSDPPLTNQETWFIAGGSAGAAMYTFKQPGLYVYLTHNLIEAVLLGGAAHIKVDGKWDDDLMKSVSGAKAETSH